MLVPEAFVAMCKGRFLAVPLVEANEGVGAVIDGVRQDAEISPAPVLITEHEVVFARVAALPVQRANCNAYATDR